MENGWFKDITVMSDDRLAVLGSNDIIYLFEPRNDFLLDDKIFSKYNFMATIILASPCATPKSLLAVAGKTGLCIYDCS